MKAIFRILGTAAAVAATGAAIVIMDKLLNEKAAPIIESIEFPEEAEKNDAEAARTAEAYAEGEARAEAEAAAPAEETAPAEALFSDVHRTPYNIRNYVHPVPSHGTMISSFLQKMGCLPCQAI